jgi:hypothetical protein
MYNNMAGVQKISTSRFDGDSQGSENPGGCSPLASTSYRLGKHLQYSELLSNAVLPNVIFTTLRD